MWSAQYFSTFSKTSFSAYSCTQTYTLNNKQLHIKISSCEKVSLEEKKNFFWNGLNIAFCFILSLVQNFVVINSLPSTNLHKIYLMSYNGRGMKQLLWLPTFLSFIVLSFDLFWSLIAWFLESSSLESSLRWSPIAATNWLSCLGQLLNHFKPQCPHVNRANDISPKGSDD